MKRCAQLLVRVLADRLVEAAPPDVVVDVGLVDDVLVLGRAAGVLAGADDERPLPLRAVPLRARWRARTAPPATGSRAASCRAACRACRSRDARASRARAVLSRVVATAPVLLAQWSARRGARALHLADRPRVTVSGGRPQSAESAFAVRRGGLYARHHRQSVNLTASQVSAGVSVHQMPASALAITVID